MSQTLEGNHRAVPKRRRLRILGLFLTIPIALVFFLAVRVIPPVTGRVVDAVSGKSIRDVRLSLEMSRYEGWSVHTELHDRAKSGTFGSFFLLGALRWRGLPLPEFRSYWLTVDEGDQNSGQEEVSAAIQTMYNPMFNRRGAVVGDKRYFPLTVTFHHNGCDRVWPATCMYKPFWWGISLPLIPVLEDVNDCRRIKNLSLQENCRQLNTYRAAFVHVDSYAQVQKGKTLCAEVDHASLSSACLQQLALYIDNAAYERPIKPQVNEPTPDGMFPDSVAGLPAMNNGHCGPQLKFDGRVNCAGGYGTTARQLVAVYFERWPENSSKPKEWSHVGSQTAVTEEVRETGKVLRYQGKWYSGVTGADGKSVQYEHKINSYVWYSTNTLVEVLFYDPIPQQENFLSNYLEKFPSTSH
jgi:hypothetical protein